MLNFRGNEDLCNLGTKYLNALLCEFGLFSLQHFETFDMSHPFLPLTASKLSTLNSFGVWPTFVCFLID